MERSHYTVGEFAQRMDVGDGVTRTPRLVRAYIHRSDDERLPAERLDDGRWAIPRAEGDRWLTEVWEPKPNRWHRGALGE